MSDAFEQHDAAYVLGALEPAERAVFEAHLTGCPECRARVEELRGLVPLLADLPERQVAGTDEPVPDTLLPGLLHRASVQRRHRRVWATAAAATVAAAAVTVGVLVWPDDPAPAHGQERAMTALLDVPVAATAELDDRPWGTSITLRCRHGGDATVAGAQRYEYGLTVVDRNGTSHPLGTWGDAPGELTTFTSGTSLPAGQIRTVQITAADGRPILQLEP